MGERHWFEDLADHMGEAYLRYSFTKGTAAEVDAMVVLLGLEPGASVLDVGCGPGRHVAEFARRGFTAVGLDISRAFIEVATEAAPPGATFVRGDATALDAEAEFDAVVSLCQGGFGLGGPGPFAGDPRNLGTDLAVLAGIARALRPGGRCAVSAFSAYFQVRWLEEGDEFDPATAVNHEITEVRDAQGAVRPADLWTTCYTPRELQLLAERAGLEVIDVHSVAPGDYAARPPDLAHQEFLLVARRPDGPVSPPDSGGHRAPQGTLPPEGGAT